MTETRPLSPELLTRRDALVRVSAWLGGTMVGSSALLSGCASRDARPVAELFTATDIDYLDAVADTILPETQTPGARAAEVGSFMAVMVADTYTREQQSVFTAGLDTIESECRSDHGAGFMAVTAPQRLSLLERLDREQFDYMRNRRPDQSVHYFRMIKELTLQGYFTSEIGYTQAMRYIETPGRFEPCVPYSVGDRAWAPHA
jgi:hypothetical protein